jgi:hypothetical protein
MEQLFSLLSGQVANTIERQLKGALSPVAPYLKKLGVGVALLLVSSGVWLLGLLFLLIGLFLSISGLGHYVAALWTGVVALFLALLLTLFGILQLRRPN